MDNFKSFNDFRRELHEKEEPIHVSEKMENVGVSDSTPTKEGMNEIPERRMNKRIEHSKIKSTYLLLGVVLFLLIMGVLFLPIPLGHITLSGNTALSMEDVVFEGGIRQPINVFQINTSELENRLRHDVRVESAVVQREFPFTLTVIVKDRIPVAVVQGEYSYAVVDKDGFVIDSVQAIRQVDVPMITGRKLGNLLLGDHVTQEDVLKALVFLGRLSDDGQKVFSEINIGNAQNIMAYTRDGITVRLGDGSDMEERAKLAENMVGDVKARGLSVEYLDANLVSPFIKLKK